MKYPAIILSRHVHHQGPQSKTREEKSLNGLEPPYIEADHDWFTVTFRRQAVSIPNFKERENAPVKLSYLQKKIIEEVRKNQNITYDELAKITGRDRSTIKRNIKKLIGDWGILERVGSDKGGYWLVK